MSLDPMQKPSTKHWTYEDYLRLPDDGTRCEIIEGERFKTPAPSFRHQDAILELAVLIRAFLRERGFGTVVLAPFDVVLAEDTVVQPDLIVVSEQHGSRIQDRGLFEAPDLAIEILSPSSQTHDRVRKLRLYARHGVREYWIVDPKCDRIEVYILDGDELIRKAEHESGEVRSLVVLPGFAAPLTEIFRKRE